MKKTYLISISLLLLVAAGAVAFARLKQSEPPPNRMINFFTGTKDRLFIQLGTTGGSGGWEVRFVSDKMIEQRKEQVANFDKWVAAEAKQREIDEASGTKGVHVEQPRAPEAIYRIVAIGEDYLHLETHVAATFQKAEIVVSASNIHRIRLNK